MTAGEIPPVRVGGDSKWRTGRLGGGAIGVALLVAAALAGCSQAQPVPAGPVVSPASAETSRSSPTPSTTAAAAPLTCDDVVPKDRIVEALAAGQRADGWVVVPASTADGLISGEKAVEGAGGLSCSWRAGPPEAEAGTAVLAVSILPGAADRWTGELYGDGPTKDRRTFAGVSAAATCGDPGCGATAAVGTSWVRVDLLTGSREGGGSPFAKETDDEVFDGLAPAVESAFRAVQDASAARLRFPDHLPAAGPADCRSVLGRADLAAALHVKAVELDTSFAPDPQTGSIAAAAELRTGTSVCIVEDPRYSYPTELASVTVAPGQAWAVADLAAHADQRGDLREVELDGLPSGNQALSSCGTAGNQCTVVLTLGSTAIQVEDTEHAVSVAEAIVAGSR